jgi:uncharacterized protein
VKNISKKIANLCFFVSDLHGQIPRYQSLFGAIRSEQPAAVFLGGDLLPYAWISSNAEGTPNQSFVLNYLEANFNQLHFELGESYPCVFLILGNDDPRSAEMEVLSGDSSGVWKYLSERRATFDEFTVYGYPFVPPTPFLLKDWERYDVSRFVDTGCISPEEGWRTIPTRWNQVQHATIQKDLELLTAGHDLTNTIFLFHSPPYNTDLDLLAAMGKTYDHVPLDTHAGSIAIRRFIENRQPLLSLHGHIHESALLSGEWKCQIGRTVCYSAAHHGPELALVRFDPHHPQEATRQLI